MKNIHFKSEIVYKYTNLDIITFFSTNIYNFKQTNPNVIEMTPVFNF